MAGYIAAMATTIQVSEQMVEYLSQRKLYDKESYEEVILDLMEDCAELNLQTKQELEKARSDIKSGKFYTHEQVKKRLRL